MKEIKSDASLIAKCGLYCGACKKYLSDKCQGCSKNEKATWCKTRSCCAENSFQSCADCKTADYRECEKVNNFISKLFGMLFNSDRLACLDSIKNSGGEAFAKKMAYNKQMTIKRR